MFLKLADNFLCESDKKYLFWTFLTEYLWALKVIFLGNNIFLPFWFVLSDIVLSSFLDTLYVGNKDKDIQNIFVSDSHWKLFAYFKTYLTFEFWSPIQGLKSIWNLISLRDIFFETPFISIAIFLLSIVSKTCWAAPDSPVV